MLVNLETIKQLLSKMNPNFQFHEKYTEFMDQSPSSFLEKDNVAMKEVVTIADENFS